MHIWVYTHLSTSVFGCEVSGYWLPHLHLLMARIGLYHVKYKHMLNCNDITHTQFILSAMHSQKKSHTICRELGNICMCCSSHLSSFLKPSHVDRLKQ